MADYIFLMHDDAVAEEQDWGPYLHSLRQRGIFQGGSAIGDGVCVRKSGKAAPLSAQLAGFVRVRAGSIEQAKALLSGNPVFEAGGTVEIRALPQTD